MRTHHLTARASLALLLVTGCASSVQLRPVTDARIAAAERLACEEVTIRRYADAPYADNRYATYEANGCGRRMLLVCSTALCVESHARPYLPPAGEEAVAFVKLWSRYDGEGAASAIALDETVQLGEQTIMQRIEAPGPMQARGLVVRARPDVWRVAALPLRTEVFQGSRLETRYTTRSCYTARGWATCSDTELVSIPTTETRDVASGACRAEFELAPRAGATYRILYRFRSLDSCSVDCAEEVPTAEGGMTLSACAGFQVRYAEGSVASR